MWTAEDSELSVKDMRTRCTPYARTRSGYTRSRALRCWDLATGVCVRTLEEHAGSIESIAVSPDGRLAVTGGWALSLWDIATGRCLYTFGGPTAAILDVAWTPDGRYVVTGTSDEEVRVWDIVTGECVQVMTGHAGVVKSVAVTADGSRVLSGSSPIWGRNGQVILWDMSEGAPVRVFEGHAGGVNAVALSLDGRHALSGGADHSVRFWDAQSGECLRVLSDSFTNVQTVALSFDNRFAVAGSDDGVIQVWYLDWTLENRVLGDWDPGAAPYLNPFVALHRPPATELPQDASADFFEIGRALERKGKPSWTDTDLDRLMFTLGCVGYGWLARESVEAELHRTGQRGVFGWLGRRRDAH